MILRQMVFVFNLSKPKMYLTLMSELRDRLDPTDTTQIKTIFTPMPPAPQPPASESKQHFSPVSSVYNFYIQILLLVFKRLQDSMANNTTAKPGSNNPGSRPVIRLTISPQIAWIFRSLLPQQASVITPLWQRNSDCAACETVRHRH